MLIYLFQKGIITDFWYWTVQFNLSEFASGGSLAPRIVDWVRLSFPLISLVTAWLIIPAKFKPKLLIGWMIFTIVGGIARFGLLHLQPAVPYFCLIFALMLYELNLQHKKYILSAIIVLIVLWMGYFYSRQTNLWHTKFYDAQTDQVVTTIKEKTEPGDKIFLLGVHPHLYELTKTLPPGRLFIFQFPWFFKIAGERVLASLKDDPPKLIVYDNESQIDGQHMRDYGKFLLDYIRENYSLSRQSGSFEYYENRH